MTFVPQPDGDLEEVIKTEYSGPEPGEPPTDPPGEPGDPPQDPPPADPPGEPPVDTEIKLNSFLDGKFKTPEELQGTVERGLQYTEDVEKELTTLRESQERFNNLEAREAEIKSFNPYKDKRFYQLEKLIEQEPDNAELYSQITFGNISDLDLVRMDIKSQHPDTFKEDPDSLQTALENEYPALFDENKDAESKEYKADLLKLKMKAETIRKGLKAKVDGVEVPDLQAEETAKVEKAENLKKAWKPKIEGMKKHLTKLPVTVEGDKEGDEMTFFEIDIPKEDQETIIEFAENYVNNNQIDVTDENVQNVLAHAKMLWVVQNLPKYNALIAEKANEANSGEWRKLIHNSSKPGVGAGHSRVTEDAADVIYNDLIKSGSGNINL